MSDSRSRFEKWVLSVNANDGHTIDRIEPGEYRSAATDCAWEAWQAAEAETARQCASVAAGWVEGGNIANDIRANFPEAFK